MSDLLTIHLISPSIEEFDPTEAIALWNSGSVKRRRRKHIIDEITGEVSLVEVAVDTGDDQQGGAAAAEAVTKLTHDADSDYDSCFSGDSDIDLDLSMNLSDLDDE